MPPSGGPEVEDDGLDRNLERLIFWGFCVNPFGIGPLHYVWSCSNLSFEFAEKKSTRLPIDTVFFKPLNKSMVIVHYIPGFFFAKLIF